MAVKKLWQRTWRTGLCSLLLLWIFHCIFVNEARISHPDAQWSALPRLEQWRLGWQEGPGRLWQTLTLIDPGWLLVSVGLMGMTLVIGVIRWRMALQVQGIRLPFSRAAEITLVAHFFNSFLLGSTGGDLMKAYYAARESHQRKTDAVVTVFVDRLIGLWAMLLFAGVLMVPNARVLFGTTRPRLLASLLILAMLAGCTGLALLAFRGGFSRHWPGARDWLRRLPKGGALERSLDSCRRFGQARFFVTRTLLLSMALNVVCVLQWQVVGHGLHLSLSPLLLYAVVPMVICISALPITPSGLGVRENLFLFMLSDDSIATPALSLSLLAYAGSLAWSLIGGVVYLLLKEKHHLADAALQRGEQS